MANLFLFIFVLLPSLLLLWGAVELHLLLKARRYKNKR